MKTLIIYYSLKGNTALIAGHLKSSLEADVFEIKLENDKKRRGFFWALSQTIKNKRPVVKPFTMNMENYDLIIFGTPVWADSPSAVLLSFIEREKITGKKAALFCCHAGGYGKALEKLKAALPGNTFTGEIDFTRVSKIKPDELKQKVEDWAKTLRQ